MTEPTVKLYTLTEHLRQFGQPPSKTCNCEDCLVERISDFTVALKREEPTDKPMVFSIVEQLEQVFGKTPTITCSCGKCFGQQRLSSEWLLDKPTFFELYMPLTQKQEEKEQQSTMTTQQQDSGNIRLTVKGEEETTKERRVTCKCMQPCRCFKPQQATQQGVTTLITPAQAKAKLLEESQVVLFGLMTQFNNAVNQCKSTALEIRFYVDTQINNLAVNLFVAALKSAGWQVMNKDYKGKQGEWLIIPTVSSADDMREAAAQRPT